MKEQESDKRLVIGTIFIGFGLIWALQILNVIPDHFIQEFFTLPGLSLMLGVVLVATSRHKILGAIFMLFGGFHLLDEFFDIPYELAQFLWPIGLVGLGLVIILKSKKKNWLDGDEGIDVGTDSDYFDDMAIFGGGEKIFSSNNFKGGKVTSIFGGSQIDLRKTQLSEGKKEIDVFLMFGGTKLIIPDDWNIKNEVTPIFGGFSDNRKIDPNAIPDPRKTITIKGLALFGGGEINSY